VISLGKKINMFIDRTNRITRILNRVTVRSDAMYDSENLRTLEAMKRTVREVRRPMGSRITGNVMLEVLRLKISQ